MNSSVRNTPVSIRVAVGDDIPSIVSLERACPTAAHWSEEQYQDLFSSVESVSPRLCLIAKSASATVVGFLIARHIAPEWELENLVVSPAARRKSIGIELLLALLSQARQTNSEAVFLEVRESNSAARQLYEKAGFLQTGRRKSYYANPLEDAIVYRLILR